MDEARVNCLVCGNEADELVAGGRVGGGDEVTPFAVLHQAAVTLAAQAPSCTTDGLYRQTITDGEDSH